MQKKCHKREGEKNGLILKNPEKDEAVKKMYESQLVAGLC